MNCDFNNTFQKHKYVAISAAAVSFLGINVFSSLIHKQPEDTDKALFDSYKKLLYGLTWPFSAIIRYVVASLLVHLRSNTKKTLTLKDFGRIKTV